jgi:DNA-binding TFAR19-related protein (PDSD5 family)
MILKQVMLPAAAERLATVSLVKPEKARAVEDYIIDAAQTGKLPGKVSEEQLKDLLVQVTAQTQKATKVTITRRRHAFDSDDDDDDDF